MCIAEEHVTELQKITLRDVLRQKGLSERRIEDIFLLLRFKPKKVQMAFYYVTQGMTHQQAAYMTGVKRQQITKWMQTQCSDVKDYLMAPAN